MKFNNEFHVRFQDRDVMRLANVSAILFCEIADVICESAETQCIIGAGGDFARYFFGFLIGTESSSMS